jgi:uroporphyrinogen-III decarboxylase
MTNRERFNNTFNFKPVDRVPMIEWAGWWDKTYTRWFDERLPTSCNIFEFFGLDNHRQFWLQHKTADCPTPAFHGASLMENEEDYENFKKYLFPENAVSSLVPELKRLKSLQERGDIPIWITFEGFFWFPRTIFGIENHLYSFYDYPELYHRICSDLVDFQLKMLEQFCEILTPDFMTFAEDMSYNHGPMLSKELFDEFLAPYYRKVVPILKQHGIKIFVDTDGNVMPMIPWLREVGIEGILPLERQAGVDVAEIRRLYPDLLMLGGYNKLIMKDGEAAMRAEFERLLPTMKSGGYIASVDHQTPPDVSLENYKIYMKLFEEYSVKAAL